jgi:3-phosphoglycerate kinase
MNFNKKTIKDIELTGKTVLVRADYNVPLDARGRIASDYRIEQSLPTLRYLLSKRCKIIICSHLGRPEGKKNSRESLRHIAERLSVLLDHKVAFSPKTTGPMVEEAAKNLKAGQILMLENLRFDPGEEANDVDFAKQLAELADVFVQDGFGVVHRAHASTDAITKLIPSVAGLLLEKEVTTIENAIEKPDRPLMAILGGAKISDKIELLERFVDIADFVAVGGAMANTFLRAEGIKTGKSLTEPADIPLAKKIIAKARAKAKKQQFIFYIPQDGVVAKKMDSSAKTRIVDWDAHVIAAIESYPKHPDRKSGIIGEDEYILDVGPFSASFIAGATQLAHTVIWNGTMGVAEVKGLTGSSGPFAHGTELIMEAMLGQLGHKPFSIVGGGDTAAYVEGRKMTGLFDHVSTGGGASLELMAGRKLPGIEALQNK